MRHGFAIYFVNRISNLRGNRPSRGLDNFSAERRFWGFLLAFPQTLSSRAESRDLAFRFCSALKKLATH